MVGSLSMKKRFVVTRLLVANLLVGGIFLEESFINAARFDMLAMAAP